MSKITWQRKSDFYIFKKYLQSPNKMSDTKKQIQATWEIMLYQDPNGQTEINVTFENDTVRLSQEQMAKLFGKWRTTITEHIQNIFKEKELDEKLVCRESRRTTKHGAIPDKTQKNKIKYYNLDVIISVWYRVKSLRWTQFRIRATQRLKDYLIKWYAINQKRLEETKLNELEQVVALIKKNIEHAWLSHQETAGLLDVITNYTHSWIILQKYDEGTLELPTMHSDLLAELTYQEARKAVVQMKEKFLPENQVSELFGIERNDEFRWILESIYQRFWDQELYPSIEEKAAHLLFFIIKNHPFADGNKKIWAFLFLRFLAKNNCLYDSDWVKKIDDHTLVALTLLVATCDTSQKDMIIKLILNFISK